MAPLQFFLISIVVFISTLCSAHFTQSYPPPRALDIEKEVNFCGGYPVNASGRHPFPLSGPAPVIIDSHHKSAQIAVLLSTNPDPSSFADFNTSGKTNYVKPYG
uniref:Putative secreted protein n=1 Tax=Hemileia vastatrix TaxID=203904 RepID=T1UMZ5_9BASI|nr:putative secreted protein [Hemileia vastatrix]